MPVTLTASGPRLQPAGVEDVLTGVGLVDLDHVVDPLGPGAAAGGGTRAVREAVDALARASRSPPATAGCRLAPQSVDHCHSTPPDAPSKVSVTSAVAQFAREAASIASRVGIGAGIGASPSTQLGGEKLVAEACAGAASAANASINEDYANPRVHAPVIGRRRSDLQSAAFQSEPIRAKTRTTSGSKSVPAPRAISRAAASRSGLPVRALVDEHVEDVGEVHEPRRDRDRVARQAVGIAAAVPALVVVAGDRLGRAQQVRARRPRAPARRARRGS